MNTKIIIAGSRSFNDYEGLKDRVIDYLIELAATKGFNAYASNLTIISGMADGADILGTRFALETPLVKLIQRPANWAKYGKIAGCIRNKQMAKEANCVIVFWDGHSNGTKDMIKQAKAKNLPLRVITYKWNINDDTYTYKWWRDFN